jgi:hypothetical protein
MGCDVLPGGMLAMEGLIFNLAEEVITPPRRGRPEHALDAAALEGASTSLGSSDEYLRRS